MNPLEPMFNVCHQECLFCIFIGASQERVMGVFYLPQSTLRPLIYYFKIDSTTSCHLLFTCRHPVCCLLLMEPPATLLGRRHTSWTAIPQNLHRFSWPIGVWSVECWVGGTLVVAAAPSSFKSYAFSVSKDSFPALGAMFLAR